MIQGHGDDLYRYTNIVSNFSSNIYTKLNLLGLQQHLCSCISSVHAYPEPDAHSLAQLLVTKLNITTDNILLTNGATEAIYQIAHLFGGSNASIIIPTFSEYEDACRIHKITLNFATSLEELAENTQLLWLCNPNNPTGAVHSRDDIVDFVENNPQIITVIDQSYAYFTHQNVWTAEEALQHKNVILIHSMTKRYAIPGLRLGYVTAHELLMAQLRTLSMPWSVNQLAIEAGKYLLSEGGTALNFDLSRYLSEAKQLRENLSRIVGLTVMPSSTHFFLCSLANGKTAAELKEHLASKHGILIRDAANFRGLDERYFRLAAQSSEENSMLVKAIEQWI